MTCKDCVYCDKCYSHIEYSMGRDEFTGEETRDIEKRCTGFKNKHNLVEVVRCKDCEYCERNDNNDYLCCAMTNPNYVALDDYCSHGVRKEQEGK